MIFRLSVASLLAAALSAQVITTLAGTDTVPAADGTPALQGSIGANGVAADAQGNLYVCDIFRDVVMKVDTAGRLSRFAGNGIPIYAGDGGPAADASLNDPERVVVDAQGNVYISEAGNHRVRRVAPNGIITTVAGNGVRGFSGDGGPATQASLNLPVGLALDAQGNLYIADYDNRRVRRVTPSGTITTVAGNGQSGFSGDGGPATSASINAFGVGISPAGELYIADTFNNRIRRVSAQGVITTVAGNGQAAFSGDGGPAAQAALFSPFAVVFDAQGNYYISDYANNRVRRVSAAGIITTFAGNGQEGGGGNNGPSVNANLNYPYSIAVDNQGNVLIADTFGFRVKRAGTNGILTFVAGNGRQLTSPEGVAATSGLLNGPHGVTFDRNGEVLFADTFNRKIMRIRNDGTLVTVAGTGEIGAGGDGGPATLATFKDPEDVAVDATGNIFIADTLNHRIRRVNAQGVIATVAGNGGVDCSPGANLPYQPHGLAFDTAGNLYFSDSCHMIRRISPAGVMTVFAGSGAAGFADGAGQNARFNNPGRIAFDRQGNLYVADEFNHRVRRIDPNGNVTTIAGNGTPGFSGDGGPATAAQLSAPRAVAVDNNGNVLISDYSNHRVRIVSQGRISTFAGNGVEAWAGDGGPAAQASVRRPEGMAVDAAGNVLLGDRGNNRIRRILAAAPPVQVSFGGAQSISFSQKAGTISEFRGVAVNASIIGLGYQAVVDQAWLEIDPPRGATPASLRLRANAATLAPGSYRGSVTIRTPFGAPAERSIPVTLEVSPGDAPSLAVATRSLTFSFVEGSEPLSATLAIANGGAGSIAWTLSTAAPFLALSENSGSATLAQPARPQVTADPGSLPPGAYTATVRVASASTNQTFDVPVTMTIAPAQARLVLSQTGLAFRAAANGGSPLPQEVGILNAGQGVMNWAARVTTLTGSGWLTLSAASGAVQTPLSDVATIEVRANPAGLAPGEYFGRVDVSAPGNTPQTVSVQLTVVPAGTVLAPEIRPTGLIFTGTQGVSPASQVIRIANRGAAPVTVNSTRQTLDGRSWFAHLPVGTTVEPNNPARIVVQPDYRDLPPGEYQGSLTFQFADGTSQTVRILNIVAAAAQDAGSKSPERTAGGCTPNKLNMVLTTSQTLNATFGQPTNLEVKVVDSCNQAVTSTTRNASVSASFTPLAEPSLKLNHTRDGFWNSTFQPKAIRSGTVTASITAFVALPNLQFLANQIDVQINVADGTVVPVIAPGAVLNGASFAGNAPLAPGSLVTLFGASLANSDQSALGSVPLPNEFNDVQVRLGDRPLPLLFVGRTQINAQVPFDLPLNTQHQILVRRGTALSVPENLSVGAAQPAIFTRDQNGRGQGAIVNGVTNVLADAANPVRAGDVVSIYCTGLGRVEPAVAEGTVAPANQLSRTVTPIAVRIGGRNADVQFSGLAPGFIGLYQVNAFVPPGVTGNEVPVVIEMAGQQSPPVTIAVR